MQHAVCGQCERERITTQWNRALKQIPRVAQLVKKFPAIHPELLVLFSNTIYVLPWGERYNINTYKATNG
jgi:hypothetical protein